MVYVNMITGFVQTRSILGDNSLCIPMDIYCPIFLSYGESNVIKATHFYKSLPFLGLNVQWQAVMNCVWQNPPHLENSLQTNQLDRGRYFPYLKNFPLTRATTHPIGSLNMKLLK